MSLHLIETTTQPARFFELLPEDWQDEIVPYWPNYQATARIFLLVKNGEIPGGGIVFSTVSPDTMAYRKTAQRWLDRGYLYIAFLYFDEKYRGQGLGSAWLQALEKHLPGRCFWLSIDEEGLRHFYEKNGYRVVEQVEGDYGMEWIMVKENRQLEE